MCFTRSRCPIPVRGRLHAGARWGGRLSGPDLASSGPHRPGFDGPMGQSQGAPSRSGRGRQGRIYSALGEARRSVPGPSTRFRSRIIRFWCSIRRRGRSGRSCSRRSFAQHFPGTSRVYSPALFSPGSEAYELASDVYHPNTISVLDRALALGEPGHLLICLRELDPSSCSIPDRESRGVALGSRRARPSASPHLAPERSPADLRQRVAPGVVPPG